MNRQMASALAILACLLMQYSAVNRVSFQAYFDALDLVYIDESDDYGQNHHEVARLQIQCTCISKELSCHHVFFAI
jgi:hypothetical protein